MSFKDSLINDLNNSFFNKNEFGEEVTLVRNGTKVSLSALYDEQSLDGSSIGAEVEAISHRPRLFVTAADLPNGKPVKGDRFELNQTPFHSKLFLVAKDFVFEKDGVVIYELQVVKS